MIALADKTDAKDRNNRFEKLLPRIRDYARLAFREEPVERREDLIAEAVANAFVAFDRLIERGMESVIYPAPLAMYAVKQVRAGRRIGNRLNANDVLSPYAQRKKGFLVDRLDQCDENGKAYWQEILVEDRKAGPADTAASRIDFNAWLGTMSQHQRSIAENLAMGEKTNHVAKQFQLSAGRISQLRRELFESWHGFHGLV